MKEKDLFICNILNRFEIDELVSMVWCCCNASRLANESWEMMSTMSEVALERRHFSHGFCFCRSIFRLRSARDYTESLDRSEFPRQSAAETAATTQLGKTRKNVCFFLLVLLGEKIKWNKRRRRAYFGCFFSVLCCECVPVSRIPAVTFWTSVRVSDIDQKAG